MVESGGLDGPVADLNAVNLLLSIITSGTGVITCSISVDLWLIVISKLVIKSLLDTLLFENLGGVLGLSGTLEVGAFAAGDVVLLVLPEGDEVVRVSVPGIDSGDLCVNVITHSLSSLVSSLSEVKGRANIYLIELGGF